MNERYSDPEKQAAFEEGRKVGRVEGMISYQKHIVEFMQEENERLREKLKRMEGGRS